MAVRDDFTAGEVLAAADLNDTFASKVPYAYGTATPSTTVDGFVWFDENSTPPAPKFWDGAAFQGIGGGKVLQVVSVTKTDTFATSSTSFVDVTGLSATITPSSATSKILITVAINLGWDSNRVNQARLMRDATAISIGDAASSRTQTSLFTAADDFIAGGGGARWMLNGAITYLDSPATTSATVYKMQIGAVGDTDPTNIYVNRTGNDPDAAVYGRTASTITLMEVAG